MAILVSKKVTKRFGGLEAVSKVDLEVPENAIYSVIGPNGAGKTTFYNCVTGFYTADGGSIVFFGASLLGLTPDRIARAGIARTYQNIRLFGTMTAIENILVGQHHLLRGSWLEAIANTRRMRNEEKAALDEAVRLLRFVGLAGLGDRRT